MDFDEAKRMLGNAAKKVLKSRTARRIMIIAIAATVIIILLVSSLKLILHIDTAGDGKSPATVPGQVQQIMTEAGITRTSATSANGTTSGGGTITNYEESGDGYDSVTTVGDKTYRNYKQYDNGNSYSGNHYWEGTIATDACGPTSVTIVLSGYKFDYNPGQVVSIMQNELGYDDSTSFSHLTDTLKHIGNIESEEHYGVGTANDIPVIRENLKAGRPVIINAPNHYVVYLGEDSNGNLIISDPGRQDGGNDRYGATLEDVINNGNITCGYILIKSDLSSTSNTKNSLPEGYTVTGDSSTEGTTTSTVSTNAYGHVVENGRGGYKIDIDLDAKVEEMMKALDEEGNNPINNYLKTDKTRKEYMKSFIQAAMVNRYPDLRTKSEIESKAEIPDGEVQGIIKVRRRTKDTAENDDGEILQYISYEKYNELKDKLDKSIFNYYTIDKSGQIVVSGYEQRTVDPQEVDCGGDPNYVEGDVEDTSLQPMYKITDSKINYVQQIEKYTMPFEMLWTLLVYSGDEDFVYDLAKLVMDSEIVITVHDNITNKDVEDVQTYVKNYHNKEKETFTDATDLSYEKYPSKTYDEYRPEEKYNYTITNHYTYESNNPSIAVTYADSWTMKYENEYKKTSSENTDKDETTQEDEKEYIEDKKKSKSNMSETEMRNDSKSLLPQREKEYKSNLEGYYKSKLEDTSKTTLNNYEKQLEDEYNKSLEEYKKKLQNDKTKDYDKELKEYEKKQEEEKKTKIENYKTQLNENKESSMQKVKYNIKDIALTYYSKFKGQKSTVTTVTKEWKYTSQPGETAEKTDPNDEEDNFVKLLKKHSDAKESLDTLSGWFFESIEDQESICDMLDLIKYLLYKVDDTDYGVTEFDFEEYDTTDFTDTTGVTGTTSNDLLGFIQAAEGGMSGEYVDGDNYVVYNGGDGVLTVGYGIVIGDADGTPWYPKIIPNPYEGLRIPKATVDKIFNIKMKVFTDALDTSLAQNAVTLKQCQYDAMTSFLYNLGEAYSDTIVQAYKNGGDQGYWEEIKQYINPYEYRLGLMRRRSEEYELFTKGDYKYDPNNGDTVKYY